MVCRCRRLLASARIGCAHTLHHSEESVCVCARLRTGHEEHRVGARVLRPQQGHAAERVGGVVIAAVPLVTLDDSNGRVQRSQTVPIHHVYDPCRGPVIDALDCAT